jgi:coiled-coil domain-containing protein 12
MHSRALHRDLFRVVAAELSGGWRWLKQAQNYFIALYRRLGTQVRARSSTQYSTRRILSHNMSATHASLGAAADERKARLAKLKSLKRKQPGDEIVAPESARSPSPPASPDVTKLHLSGRNYDPETKGPKLGFEAPPTLALEKPTLEQQAAEVEAEIRRKAEEEEKDEKSVDMLFQLQPKKPNWDLKRDLDKKLEVLNVRTDNAIASLVKERIESAQKAARAKSGAGAASAASQGGEEMGMEGTALVESVKVREREEELEERREREDEELA